MFETKKEPKKIPNWVKILIALLVAAPGTWWGINSRMNATAPDSPEAAQHGTDAESRKIREQLVANLAKGKTDGEAKELEISVADLEKSAASLTGTDAIFYQGLANVIRSLIPVTKQHEEAYQFAIFTDVMDVTPVKTRDDIRSRLKHLQDIQSIL